MKFKFALYQRRFKQPLRTSHGIWQLREGIIISLENSEGKIALGEIAPLPWFGSETITQAWEFCQSLGGQITPQEIAAIPNQLPACQFALGSAWLALRESFSVLQTQKPLECCYLLPAGQAALAAWQSIYQQQKNRTFKWKIGVESFEREIDILQQLVNVLPPKTQLRLDANGGLNLNQAQQLLAVTDHLPQIEFVEQPLSPKYWIELNQLSQEYQTPLALDESIANFEQLRSLHRQGWQGIYVIKAGIMGFPQQLEEYCRQHSLDIVFSSVLETTIGRNAALQLAQQLNHPRAVGFGVNHLFLN